MLNGSRAGPGRLRAWANALEKNLTADERISGDPYNWLTYRVKKASPMLIADAVKVYVAGLRVQDQVYATASEREAALRSGDCLHSVYEWQMDFAKHLPVVQAFLYGYGIKGRFVGTYDAPLIPVMLPPEYIPALSEELANLIVQRDDGQRRKAVGARIESFLVERATRDAGRGVSWNFSAYYAIEQIAMLVLPIEYFLGRFGPLRPGGESAMTEVAESVAREVRRMLSDTDPRAFERTLKRLGTDLEEMRKRRQ